MGQEPPDRRSEPKSAQTFPHQDDPEGTDAISLAPAIIYSTKTSASCFSQRSDRLPEAGHSQDRRRTMLLQLPAVLPAAAPISSPLMVSRRDRGCSNPHQRSCGIPIELALASVDQRLREVIRDSHWSSAGIRSSADVVSGSSRVPTCLHRYGGAGPWLPFVQKLM